MASERVRRAVLVGSTWLIGGVGMFVIAASAAHVVEGDLWWVGFLLSGLTPTTYWLHWAIAGRWLWLRDPGASDPRASDPRGPAGPLGPSGRRLSR